MRYFKNILWGFSLVVFTAYAQQGTVKYKIQNLKIDLPEGNDVKYPELYKEMQAANKFIEEEVVFCLEFNAIESLFMVEDNQYDFVALSKKYGVADYDLQTVLMNSYANKKIYKNISENNIVEEFDYCTVNILIDDESIDVNWQLTNETLKIGDYLCYKATGVWNYRAGGAVDIEEEVVAWYTSEIPLGYGPLAFKSLPGLILRLDTPYYAYVASKIQFIKKENKPKSVKKPTIGHKMTYKEFYENQKVYVDNWIEMD
ncbi:MAG: GLPGLI family protein [Flavobacteriaceae bacterium]